MCDYLRSGVQIRLGSNFIFFSSFIGNHLFYFQTSNQNGKIKYDNRVKKKVSSVLICGYMCDYAGEGGALLLFFVFFICLFVCLFICLFVWT